MRALTLRQPWAWAVIEGLKPIENRSWCPNRYQIGQPFAVHAGLAFDTLGFSVFERCAREARCWSRYQRDFEDVRGAVLGIATLGHKHVAGADDRLVPPAARPWFFGPYGFPLTRIAKLSEPLPCRGALGFWELPSDVERKIIAATHQLEVA